VLKSWVLFSSSESRQAAGDLTDDEDKEGTEGGTQPAKAARRQAAQAASEVDSDYEETDSERNYARPQPAREGRTAAMAGRHGEASGLMVSARAGRRREVTAGTDDEESDHRTAGAESSAEARPMRRRRPADADGEAVGAGAREEEESSEEREAEGPRAGGDKNEDEDVRGPCARYARHGIFKTGMCLLGE
jgi:hypothetical protein